MTLTSKDIACWRTEGGSRRRSFSRALRRSRRGGRVKVSRNENAPSCCLGRLRRGSHGANSQLQSVKGLGVGRLRGLGCLPTVSGPQWSCRWPVRGRVLADIFVALGRGCRCGLAAVCHYGIHTAVDSAVGRPGGGHTKQQNDCHAFTPATGAQNAHQRADGGALYAAL